MTTRRDDKEWRTARRRRWPWVGAGAAMAMLMAACGTSTAPRASTAPQPANASTATVQVASEPGVGDVLVDGAGRTLYLFSPDQARAATCSGSCAAAWPPLLTGGHPVAGSGTKSALLGTVTDGNGATQVTYNHWPLYTYVGDNGPHQANGQDVNSFGGLWSAVTASGTQASARGASGSGGAY